MGSSTSAHSEDVAVAALPKGMPCEATGSATLTVFFEGTANPINQIVTQIGLFASLVDAKDIRLYPEYTAKNHQYKMCFDGCAVTNGTMGLLFAAGLDDQCRHVCNQVDRMLAEGRYHAVTLNVVGLSRGGIAAIYLAQIAHRPPLDRTVQTNLLLFDPVPGNLITPCRYLDLFSMSTANSSMDLSRCTNLGKVLAIYPYLPLPDLAFHAPVFPMYPSTAEVVEDAVLGCHQGALFCTKSRECLLSFVRIKQWLVSVGTALKCNATHSAPFEKSMAECKEMMDHELTIIADEMVRHSHSNPAGTVVLRHKRGSALYMNKWHETISEELRRSIGESRPVGPPASEEGTTHLYLLDIKHKCG